MFKESMQNRRKPHGAAYKDAYRCYAIRIDATKNADSLSATFLVFMRVAEQFRRKPIKKSINRIVASRR